METYILRAPNAVELNFTEWFTIAQRCFLTLRSSTWARISGSSDEFEPGLMEAGEAELKETLVAPAIGLAQECPNLVIDAFHAPVGRSGFSLALLSAKCQC